MHSETVILPDISMQWPGDLFTTYPIIYILILVHTDKINQVQHFIAFFNVLQTVHTILHL